MITVACVYWGTKFSKDYVYNLKAMVERNTTIPHKFVCYSDRGVPGVETRILKPGYEGWWNKLQLFNPDTGLVGENFYLDLDVVILGNIDCFVKWGDENTMGVIRDFGQPDMFFNSSIMKWNNKICSEKIWKPYMANRPSFRRLQGDQNVVTDLMKGDPNIKIYPDEWTQSYKWLDRSRKRFSKQSWTFELLPTAKIAVFHGRPNPHESDQEWVKNNWK